MMKKMPPRFAVSLGLATAAWLILPACNTTTPASSARTAIATPQATRIAEYQADYAVLPATTQKQLANGIIAKGQNMKLVYVALGRPDLIVTTPDGKIITWTYRNYTTPVIGTNRTVVGRESKVNLANHSPLQDTMDAWSNKLLKHEVPGTVTNEAPGFGAALIIAKAPTQSWAEYGKYRENLRAITDSGRPPNQAERIALRAINERAENAYDEALTIPVIASPDPIKLDVIFFDQHVSDAIVNDSFSAFSTGPLPLTGSVAPDTIAPLSP